jgi:hypothetical protein
MERPAVIALLAFARIEMNKHPGVPLGFNHASGRFGRSQVSIEQRGNENQWELKRVIKHYKMIRRTDNLEWTSI